MWASSMISSTLSEGASTVSSELPNSQRNMPNEQKCASTSQQTIPQNSHFNQCSQSLLNQVYKFSKLPEVVLAADSPLCTRSPNPDQSQSSSPASDTSPQTTPHSLSALLPWQWTYPQSHRSSAQCSPPRGRSSEGYIDHLLNVALPAEGLLRELMTDDSRHVAYELLHKPRAVSLTNNPHMCKRISLDSARSSSGGHCGTSRPSLCRCSTTRRSWERSPPDSREPRNSSACSRTCPYVSPYQSTLRRSTMILYT